MYNPVKEESEFTSETSKTEEGDRSESIIFSHGELVELTKEAINKIIESDPLFRDLPPDATIEEIKAQTAVVQGQAITISLNRGDLPTLAVVVSFRINLFHLLYILHFC